MSDSVRPQRRQPTRLPHPWDSPGKNTGVGCHFLLQCVNVKLLSRVRPLVTPWTAAYQPPPSMGFSRQEYWSGVPLPSPYCLPNGFGNMETSVILILSVHVGTKYKRCLYLVLLRDCSGHTPLPNLHSTCFQMKETNDISTSK